MAVSIGAPSIQPSEIIGSCSFENSVAIGVFSNYARPFVLVSRIVWSQINSRGIQSVLRSFQPCKKGSIILIDSPVSRIIGMYDFNWTLVIIRHYRSSSLGAPPKWWLSPCAAPEQKSGALLTDTHRDCQR